MINSCNLHTCDIDNIFFLKNHWYLNRMAKLIVKEGILVKLVIYYNIKNELLHDLKPTSFTISKTTNISNRNLIKSHTNLIPCKSHNLEGEK